MLLHGNMAWIPTMRKTMWNWYRRDGWIILATTYSFSPSPTTSRPCRSVSLRVVLLALRGHSHKCGIPKKVSCGMSKGLMDLIYPAT